MREERRERERQTKERQGKEGKRKKDNFLKKFKKVETWA